MNQPTTACVMGVDIGTQSTKAVLVRADGQILARCSEGYQVETPKPLWAQQWPNVWLDAVVSCIKGVLAQVNPAQAAIKSMCISSLYGGAGIPVDAEGKALYPCLIWLDRRAQAQVDWVRSTVDTDRLLNITGNGVDSYYGFTKMFGCATTSPPCGPKPRSFCHPTASSMPHSPGRWRWTTALLATSVACTTCATAAGPTRRWPCWASRFTPLGPEIAVLGYFFGAFKSRSAGLRPA